MDWKNSYLAMYGPTAHLLMANLPSTHHWPQQSNPNGFGKHTFVMILPFAGEAAATFQDSGLGGGQMTFLTSMTNHSWLNLQLIQII